MEAVAFADQNEIKVKGRSHLKDCVFISFRFFFLFPVVYRNLFKDKVGLLKTFQNHINHFELKCLPLPVIIT